MTRRIGGDYYAGGLVLLQRSYASSQRYFEGSVAVQLS